MSAFSLWSTLLIMALLSVSMGAVIIIILSTASNVALNNILVGYGEKVIAGLGSWTYPSCLL